MLIQAYPCADLPEGVDGMIVRDGCVLVCLIALRVHDEAQSQYGVANLLLSHAGDLFGGLLAADGVHAEVVQLASARRPQLVPRVVELDELAPQVAHLERRLALRVG